jgi:peroxiredoxin
MAGDTAAVRKRNRGLGQRQWRRRAWLLTPVLGLGIVAVLGLIVFPRLATSVETPAQQANGPTVPDFAIRTLDGGTFRLSEHRGRVVAVYTMAGWCLSCIPEAQAWARLYPEYHQRGLDVLVLSVDPTDTPGSLAGFWDRAGRQVSALTWAIDKDQMLTRLLDVRTLDQTIIIDREGRVAYVDYGPTSPDQLRRVLDQLMQEGQ